MVKSLCCVLQLAFGDRDPYSLKMILSVLMFCSRGKIVLTPMKEQTNVALKMSHERAIIFHGISFFILLELRA